MRWENAKVDEDSITISRTDLEKVRDHYLEVAEEKAGQGLSLMYMGKADVLTEMLKEFDRDNFSPLF